MPTAPSLSRPPRLPDAPKTDSFATPSSTPPTGTNPRVRDAAVSSSVRGNTLASGFTGQASAALPTESNAPRPSGAPTPQPRSNPRPTVSGTVSGSIGGPRQVVSAPSTPPTGNRNYGYGNPSGLRGGVPTVDPSTGAPPGTPDTSFTIPLLPQDEASIAAANRAYSDASAAAQYGMGQAAFDYGDPTQMARFGVGSINPNSALALAALKAQQQQETATNDRGRAGTLISSLALEDRGRIGAAQQRADLAANVRYQRALARFNQALIAARSTRDSAIGAARADERASALQNMPTANTASGGFPSSTSTGSRSIASRGGSGGTKTGSRATGTGRAPTVRSSAPPRVGKPSKPSKSPTTVKSPGKVSVKKPGRVGGRR